MGNTDLLRGGNLTVDATPWNPMWEAWNWDSWIKWQIDHLAALGGNCFRVIGGAGGISEGRYTLTQYLDRWAQLLDYTTSIGMKAYPTNGGLNPVHWGTTTDADAYTIFREWGALLDTYDNVIGIDPINEPFGSVSTWGEDGVFAKLTAFTQALRETTDKPIAHSQVIGGASGWSFLGRNQKLYEISDFYDFHLYYTPTDPMKDFKIYSEGWWANKPVVIGEVGINMTVDSATRAARYEAARIITNNYELSSGTLNWAVTDTVANQAADAYGLVDRSGVVRSDINAVFQTWPITR